MTSTSRRAKPLSREDRRAAIIEATIPLLVEQGAAVTTRQIAEAAGVAEGTLFRAFEDKAELLRAAMTAAFNPEAVIDEVRSVAPNGSLTELLTAWAEILDRRQRRVMRVVAAAHQILGADGEPLSRPVHPGEQSPDGKKTSHAGVRSSAAIVEAICERLGGFRDQLRVSPEAAAYILLTLIIGRSFPIPISGDVLDVDTTIDIVTRGISHDVSAPPGQSRPN